MNFGSIGRNDTHDKTLESCINNSSVLLMVLAVLSSQIQQRMREVIIVSFYVTIGDLGRTFICK